MLVFIITLIALLLLGIAIFEIIKYKQLSQKQNIKLIQLYLHTKLLDKALKIVNSDKEVSKEVEDLFNLISQYFQTQDLVFYNAEHVREQNQDNLHFEPVIDSNSFHSKVIDLDLYLNHHQETIDKLKEGDTFLCNDFIDSQKFNFNYYIIPIQKNNKILGVLMIIKDLHDRLDNLELLMTQIIGKVYALVKYNKKFANPSL